MKKMLLIMIIIASLSVMFGLDSEASDVVGYVKYELTANDFNMIALPMDSGITSVSELATAIGEGVESISTWDNTSHSWSQFVVGIAGNDFAVMAGTSVLVYLSSTENIDFYCAGNLPTQANYDIVANDYNQIMIPLNKSELVTVSDVATSLGAGIESISTWDNTSHSWSQFVVGVSGNDFNIAIGDGLLLYSNSDIAGWNAPAAKRTITKTSARARK